MQKIKIEKVSQVSLNTKNYQMSKSRMPKPLSILLRVVLIVVFVLALLVLGVNIFVRAAYSTFYDESQPEFATPGINSGFVPQDIAYLEDADAWLFSGYLADDSASPIWRRATDGQADELFVSLPDGSAYIGHGSGITTYGDYVFLTCDDGYLVLRTADFENAVAGESVVAIDYVELELTPAFLNISGGYLFAGEFYHPRDYLTDETHHYTMGDGTENKALMYVYPLDASAKYGVSEVADRVYSIPSLVQGCTTTSEGNLMLSQSYGLASSTLAEYDTSKMSKLGSVSTGEGEVELYGFDQASKVSELVAPPMTEGITTVDERIYIADEAACNKYIFGKLYGAWEVYSIKS
jgi:hypothetical protein